MEKRDTETQFHADQIDQMDLALDQLALKDRNYDRFALLLVDNVMELALHRFAKSRSGRGRLGEPEPRKDVREALGGYFKGKVTLARREHLLSDDEAASINYLHEFRNRAHHAGVRHEGILHVVAVFYFKLACAVMARLANGNGWSEGSDTTYSHRAMKYLGKRQGYPANQKKVQDAWKRFSEIAEALEKPLASDLHSDLKEMVDHCDEYIRYLAEDGFKRMSRKEAVIDAQLHRVWSTAAADKFVAKRANDRAIQTVEDAMNCLRQEWDWPVKGDPIPGWTTNLDSLGGEKSDHVALKKYCDFLQRNDTFFEDLSYAVADLDEGLDRAYDEAREEGRLIGQDPRIKDE